MTNDILADAREFIGDRHERLQTHSDECWRWHPACMVGRLAREVERLRTIINRVVDQDCTLAVQGGEILADDEVVCRVERPAHEMAGTATACAAERDTTQPRNGAVCTPSTHTTPGECSRPRDGTSEPVAWWVRGCEYDTGCEYEFVALLKEQAELAATQGGKAVPLYQSPSLTDAEREAVEIAVEYVGSAFQVEHHAAVLRGLLERLG